ncbi:MAG TPA: alpha/beta hydrolase [Blastocatellia bacterium]|nr:alpha/beta hydrolase [Blastocatellia bacterium]
MKPRSYGFRRVFEEQKNGRLALLAPGAVMVCMLFLSAPGLASPALGQTEAGKTFQAPGATIYYEVRGAGARGLPLVVVNGGPGFDHSYLHCSDVWDELARARPVVFYDQRGNGRSGALKPGQSCTLADQISDLDALIVHLGYAKVDMLGHSWGGYLSMAYSARHPERIEKLIICDSASPRWQDTEFMFKYMFPDKVANEDANNLAVSLGDERAAEENLKTYLSMLFYSEQKRDQFLMHASEYRIDREVNRLVNQDLTRFDLNPELPKFKFPVLVLTGRYDINVAPSTAFKIHKEITGSHFVVFERSGHLPFYEEPEKFLEVVNQFLEGGM